MAHENSKLIWLLLRLLYFLVCNNHGYLVLQHWDLVHNDIPEDLQVNPKIPVDQHIAEPGNGFPVCYRALFLDIITQVFDCFSDDLKIAYNRIDPLSGAYWGFQVP